jgi:hypothetical protein
LHQLMPGAQNAKWQLAAAGKVRHAVTYRDITILPFVFVVIKLPDVAGAERVSLHDLSRLPVSNLTWKVARAALAATNSVPGKR